MSHLRLFKLAALLVPTACALVACMDSSSSSSSSGGEGGSGGSIVFISTGSTSGPGGPSSGTGNTGTGIPDSSVNCIGDELAWQQLTAGPIACVSGEECCVIMNPCLSESQIVAADHAVEAHATWPSCAVECNDCVPRAIEVACVSGACLGRVIFDEPWDSPLRKDHCGTTSEFVKVKDGPTDVHFGCGPGPGP